MNPPVTRALLRKALQVRLSGPLADVASPCLNVCRMDDARALCEGCHRTLAEIAAWAGLDNGDRREVWRRIEARLRMEDAQ